MIFEYLDDGKILSHDGKMPLVDSFLPTELGQLRNLIRPPAEFSYYFSNKDKLPPGYQWAASSRYNGEADVNAIEHLKKILQ